MSIEEQLKTEFHHKAHTLKQPPQLDARVRQLYGDHVKKVEISMYKSKFMKVAIIALLVAVVSGFGYITAQIVFQTESEHVKLSYSADTELTLQYTTGKEVRASLNGVKEQLSDGESAVVYLDALAREDHPLFQQYPVLLVSKPIIYNSMEESIERLEQYTSHYKTPSQLPEHFSFIGGKMEHPLGGMMSPENDALIEELLDQAKRTSEAVIWKENKQQGVEFMHVFTFIYGNEEQAEIYISLQIIEDGGIAIEGTAGADMNYATVNIGDVVGHYMENNSFFLSNTDHYKSITWLEQIDTQTIIYEISSESLRVTKEDLILIADGMK